MSVKRLANGVWEVRARDLSGRSFKRRVRGSKADALAVESELLSSSAPRVEFGTVASLLDAWYGAGEWARATRSYYKRGIDDIVPSIGRVRVDCLQPFDIDNMLLSVTKGSNRKRARKTMNAALNYAVRAGAIRSNPMNQSSVKDGCPKPKRDRLTPEELAEVLVAVRGSDMEAAVIISSMCGLRREEVAALRWWSDVDLDNGVIHVSRARVQVDGVVEIKSTKTMESVRDIPISGYVLDRLREIEGSGLVVPIAPASLSQKWARFMERNGFRKVPYRSLRHTFATAAIDAQVPPQMLQALLGHTKFSTTSNYIVSLHSDMGEGIRLVGDRVLSDTKVTHRTATNSHS